VPKTTLGVCSPVHFWVQCTAPILASSSAFLTGKDLAGTAAKIPNTLQRNLPRDLGVVAGRHEAEDGKPGESGKSRRRGAGD